MNKQQFITTLQQFYDRSGINETANAELESLGNGVVTVKVITKKLLDLEILFTVEKICYLLMPIGVMFEMINISTDQYGKQKLLPGGHEVEVAVEVKEGSENEFIAHVQGGNIARYTETIKKKDE